MLLGNSAPASLRTSLSRSAQRVTRKSKSSKTLWHFEPRPPIRAEARAGTSESSRGFEPQPRRSLQRKVAKEGEFLNLGHADQCRGLRANRKAWQALELFNLDHADPRRGCHVCGVDLVPARRLKIIRCCFSESTFLAQDVSFQLSCASSLVQCLFLVQCAAHALACNLLNLPQNRKQGIHASFWGNIYNILTEHHSGTGERLWLVIST